MPARRVLLVGESPARNGEAGDAFVERLWRAVTNRPPIGCARTPRDDRLRRGLAKQVRARNLLDYWPGRDRWKSERGTRFPAAEAREAAARLMKRPGPCDVLLLAGRRVALAFGADPVYFREVRPPAIGRQTFVVPHPSGLNRWWNDPLNRDRARAFLEHVLLEDAERRRRRSWTT